MLMVTVLLILSTSWFPFVRNHSLVKNCIILSENNENETTTTSKNLIFGSLIDGWEKPPLRNRFYNAIKKFDGIVQMNANTCQRR